MQLNLNSTAKRVFDIVKPFADEMQLDIWDVRYVKEGASWFLKIFIDKDGSVDIDDCENFSRAIDEPLDEADPISTSYYLEVGSPGLGRELTRPEHFEILSGEEVTVCLIRPKDGVKDFCGILKGLADGVITIDNGEELEFATGDVAKVKLNDDIDI